MQTSDIDAQEYLQCLKKKIQHKVRNPFDLPMLNFQFQQLHGWKNATVQLETTAKIFGMRVDCFYEDVSKTANSMARNNIDQVQQVKKKQNDQVTLKKLQNIRIDKFLEKPDNLKEKQLCQKQQDAKLWQKIYSRCDNISQLMMLNTKLGQDLRLNWIETNQAKKESIQEQAEGNFLSLQVSGKSQRKEILDSVRAINRQDFTCFKQLTKLDQEIKNQLLNSIKRQRAQSSQKKKYRQNFLEHFEQFTKNFQDVEDFNKMDHADIYQNQNQEIVREAQSYFDQNQFLSDAFRFPEQFLNPANQSHAYANKYKKAVGFDLPEQFHNELQIDVDNPQVSSEDEQNKVFPNEAQNQFKPFMDSHPKKKPKKKNKQSKKRQPKKELLIAKNVIFDEQIENKSIILNPQNWLRKEKGSKQHLTPIPLQNAFPLNNLFRRNNFLFDIGKKKKKSFIQNHKEQKMSQMSQMSQWHQTNLNTQHLSCQLSRDEQTQQMQGLKHQNRTYQPEPQTLKNDAFQPLQGMIFSKKAQMGMKQIKKRVQATMQNHQIRNHLQLMSFLKICRNNPIIDPLDVFASVLHLAHQKEFVLEKQSQGHDIYLVK